MKQIIDESPLRKEEKSKGEEIKGGACGWRKVESVWFAGLLRGAQ